LTPLLDIRSSIIYEYISRLAVLMLVLAVGSKMHRYIREVLLGPKELVPKCPVYIIVTGHCGKEHEFIAQ
jgi:hypothetical protein